MSFKIVSLHEDNKIFNDIKAVKAFDLSDVLVSNHDDNFENLTDTQIYRLIMLKERLHDFNAVIYELCGVEVKCGSGARTKKVNDLIGGSKTSQHLDFMALDLHFYLNSKRVTGPDTLEMIFEFLKKMFKGLYVQLFLYKTFIHFGFADGSRNITARVGKL